MELTDDAVGAQAVAELWGVHKRYGKVEALRGIDLQLRPGELVALTYRPSQQLPSQPLFMRQWAGAHPTG